MFYVAACAIAAILGALSGSALVAGATFLILFVMDERLN